LYKFPIKGVLEKTSYKWTQNCQTARSAAVGWFKALTRPRTPWKGTPLMVSHKRQQIPPPTRCNATARSTGERCAKPAVPGATVCSMHGAGAPQVAQRAELNQLVAVVAAATQSDEPPPSPDQVLLATVELCRRILANAPAEGGPTFELAERTARVAGLAISTGAADRLAAVYRGNLNLDVKLVTEALSAAVDGLDPELQDTLLARAAAALAGAELPPLPVVVAESTELVTEDGRVWTYPRRDTDALASRDAETPSQPPDPPDNGTYVGPAEDAPQDDLRDEAGTPADSAPEDANVVEIKRPYNPNPYGGAMGVGRSIWGKSLLDD
jgi:hypothetical protein